MESQNPNENLKGKSHNDSRLVTTNDINMKETFIISKGLMFHTLLLTRVSSDCEHPSLTSVVMILSCKAGLNKAAYQAAELPGKISGSLNVRAELITKWRLLSLRSHTTDGVQRLFTATVMAKFSVKEVSESRRNQLALDGARFLKFISDSLIMEEQWADNYICNN